MFDNLPRTGLPEHFDSYGDYLNHIDILTRAGVLQDASFIWWDLRVSTARYPTLETRVADICTYLDDTAGIAALTQSILHYLYRMHRDHRHEPVYSRFLVDQNRWRAMRYGYDEGLVDFASASVVGIDELLADILEKVAPDADELGCSRELERVLDIPRRGTSAHRQLALYRGRSRRGAGAGGGPVRGHRLARRRNAQGPVKTGSGSEYGTYLRTLPRKHTKDTKPSPVRQFIFPCFSVCFRGRGGPSTY